MYVYRAAFLSSSSFFLLSSNLFSTFHSLAFNFLLFVLLRVIWSSFPIAFNCLLRSFFFSFLYFLLSFTFSLLVNDSFAFDCLSSSCSSCWGLCVCDRGSILSCPVLEQAASSMMFSDQHFMTYYVVQSLSALQTNLSYEIHLP